jgi:hypothetical protein
MSDYENESAGVDAVDDPRDTETPTEAVDAVDAPESVDEADAGDVPAED